MLLLCKVIQVMRASVTQRSIPEPVPPQSVWWTFKSRTYEQGCEEICEVAWPQKVQDVFQDIAAYAKTCTFCQRRWRRESLKIAHVLKSPYCLQSKAINEAAHKPYEKSLTARY
eukprot:Blabericola_migrator_1__9241@NODE_4964_length_918_cov_4_440658_g3117_i0_p1_GENE_NODE_4964_length_918_cov_4_440658_g3117_i0NODE_4964_length_918_cov_4_440658_g3117_i0_p1_ORF_typecomplete_len114_score13_15Integrase_H2C2/PF17921_1/0_4_NODE_4964_length_918_cov_4_440658_g3117_i0305646